MAENKANAKDYYKTSNKSRPPNQFIFTVQLILAKINSLECYLFKLQHIRLKGCIYSLETSSPPTKRHNQTASFMVIMLLQTEATGTENNHHHHHHCSHHHLVVLIRLNLDKFIAKTNQHSSDIDDSCKKRGDSSWPTIKRHRRQQTTVAFWLSTLLDCSPSAHISETNVSVIRNIDNNSNYSLGVTCMNSNQSSQAAEGVT